MSRGFWIEEFKARTRRHNSYLYATIVLALTSALFAGLFGGYYSAWRALDECANRRIVEGGLYDPSKHCLVYAAGVGIVSMEGGTCSHPCDQQLYDANRLRVAGNASTTTRRRLDSDKQDVEMNHFKDEALYTIFTSNEILGGTDVYSKINLDTLPAILSAN
jgi:hypothetical protein